MKSFVIVNSETNQRASVASWHTRHSAEMSIEAWKERHAKGGRPDITLGMLDKLVVMEVTKP